MCMRNNLLPLTRPSVWALVVLIGFLISVGLSADESAVQPASTVNYMSERETLFRLRQALGSQGIIVNDNNKLMGIAKGTGLL
jgi:hypothetical protein